MNSFFQLLGQNLEVCLCVTEDDQTSCRFYVGKLESYQGKYKLPKGKLFSVMQNLNTTFIYNTSSYFQTILISD